MLQQTLTLNASGHTGTAYLAAPPDGGPAVLVLHAWWGLTPVFKHVCDQLAQAGFVALAPDLYAGRTASTIPEAEALLNQRNPPYMDALAVEAVKTLRAHPLHTGHQPIGIVGFSLGAAWALSLAGDLPGDIAAAVLFYGVGEGNLSQSKAAFQGHFALGDEWEPDEGVQQLEDALRKAGRPVDFHRYPNTGHWFFEDDKPDHYNPSVAQLAWDRTLTFLQQHVH